MALDNVQVPEPTDPEDLLAAWRGQVRELESSPAGESDSTGELLTQLRAIADDLARGPATPLLPGSTEQTEVLTEAIANAESASIADDTVIASPFDFAALTTAIATLEEAATSVLARAEGDFAEVRESVMGEVLAIRETLASELKALREEFQKSHRRAARRSTDAGPKVLGAANETPLLAKLNDACAQLETLQAQTQRLAEILTQSNTAVPANAVATAGASDEATKALAQLQQFVESAVASLRQDLNAYAASVESHASKAHRSADLSATAAEQTISQLQARVVAAANDADQRLARLTANVQSTVERAERSAGQVEAAFAATAALRAEATSAVGNWRDEALRIVRDALSRMATETAGAANQAREARKTVIAETRTLRSELLTHAESAHAAVLSEVRRELEQTRAAFAEQRQQLASELSALEEARRQHEQHIAESRVDVSRAVTESANTTRQEVERLDAAFRDLRAHLDEVRAANGRVVSAVESVEARASAELEPLSRARQHSEQLTEVLRAEIGATLAELRDARVELEEHHGSAIDSIAATHAALTEELTRTLDGAREQLSAAQGDLRRHVDEVRTANDLVVNLAESIEASVNAELEPLADVRRQSRELSLALRDEIRRVLAELDETRARLGGTGDELRTACERLDKADQQLSVATGRVNESHERLAAAAETIEQRIEAVDRLDSAYHELHEGLDAVRAANAQIAAAAESVHAQAKAQLEPLAETREQLSAAQRDLHKHADEVRAANELVVSVAENIESKIAAQLEPMAQLRRESEELALALREQISDVLRGLGETRSRVHGTDEELRAACEQLAGADEGLATAMRRVDESGDRLAVAAGSLEQRIEAVDRLDAAYRDLQEQLEQVRTANDRLVTAAHSMEARANEELGPLAAVRQRSEALVNALRAEIRETLTGLRDAQAELDGQHRVAIDSINATQTALTIEAEQIAFTREQLSAAHGDLRKHLDEVRAANELVVNVAETVESSLKAEIEPLVEIRRESQEMSAALQEQLREAVHALDETRLRVGASDEELRAARQQVAAAEEQLSAAMRRVDASSDRLVAATDTIEQRIDAVDRLDAAYHDLREHLDEVRTANDLVVTAAERIRSDVKAELAPLAELRRRTEESTTRLDTAADVVLHRATDVQRLHAAFSDFHASLQETREQLRAANELVVHAAESVESRATAELAPLADVRRRSEELAATFDAVVNELPAAVHAKVDAAAAELATAALRIEEAEERINGAAESTQARVRQEIDALAKARSEYEAAIERFRADARSALDEARAHYERTAASLAKDFRGIAEQRRAEFSRMFDEMRGQFGAALSAIAASNAEAKADANAHVSGLAHDLRRAVEQQVRAASHEIRAELEVVVNGLRDQLERATIAEREATALRDAAESKQAREDGAALQRAVGMLSVLESLDDALQALQSEQTPEARARIDHFERQARAMAGLVELEEIGTDGDVDEERHEIVGVDAKQGELGRIVDVRQRGYAFRGRVVRRAQVVVSGASAGAARAHAAAELRP
jgi:chromosome segregation ATPase/molecular chaperone GrpE (heat shock protein)